MDILMVYWNSTWRRTLRDAENATHYENSPEELAAFARSLKRDLRLDDEAAATS